MKYNYFKPRGQFDFHPHPFDIGIPFILSWKKHYDRHFFNRLYERDQSEYEEFYYYHLDYFLNNNQGVTEQQFFEHVWQIVKDRIEQLVLEDKNDSLHERLMEKRQKLRLFTKYLETIDQWSTDKTKDEIIAAKEAELKNLEDEIAELNKKLKAARKLETEDYINITDNYLLTVLDLLLQIQELKSLDGKELVLSQTQSVWLKMVCKYFRLNNEPISFDTIRRYFPADKREPGVKHAAIALKHQLFEIKPVKKRG